MESNRAQAACLVRQRGSRQKPLARRPRVDALVVLNADGFVEVYGPPELSVFVALRLHTDCPAAEPLIDELLNLTLPRRLRRASCPDTGRVSGIFWPRNLRATGLVEKRTVEEEMDWRLELDLLRELRAIGQERRPAAVPAAILKARRAAP